VHEQATLEFTWERAEYMRMSRDYGLIRLFTATCMFGVVGCVVAGIGTATVHSPFVWAFAGFALFCVVYALWMRWFLPRSSWRKARGVQGSTGTCSLTSEWRRIPNSTTVRRSGAFTSTPSNTRTATG